MELDKLIFRKIVSFVKQARIYTKNKNYKKAIEYLLEAEKIFPQPAKEYIGAEYLYIFIGDLYLEIQDFETAKNYYFKSRECIDKVRLDDSSFKIGKVYYEEGDLIQAKKYFLSSYKGSEKKYFYPEDAKYFYLIS